MTQREQIEELREEIAGLRKQIADLAVAVVVATQRPVQYVPYPVQTPTWQPQPYITWTCGGSGNYATSLVSGGVYS